MSTNYEAHFHEAPSGYLVLETDGTILDMNRTFLSWTGHDRSALLGGSVFDLLAVGDRVVFASHAVPQLAVSGCFNEMSVELRAEDGSPVPVLMSGVRSPESGIDRIAVFKAPERRLYEQELREALHKAEAAEAARAVVEAELREKQKALEEKDAVLQANLAQSRKSEALLDSVLNAVDVGLLVLDGQGEPVMANAHLASSWQRIMGEETDFNRDRLVFGPDRVTPVPAAERPVIRAQAGEAFSNEVFWFGPAGGDQLALNVSARPVRTCETTTGTVVAFSDVTRLVQAVTAQEEFVASVSHELRTPLTSILGYLDLALDAENLPDEVSSALSVALRNAERLLDLVSDLLSVASGSAKMEFRPVNVAEIVRAGIVSAAPKARINKVELQHDLPACLSARADPKRLAQVVDNLLSNAVKYSPDGGTVTVRLAQDGGDVRLEVADTGIGMSAEEQEQVFTKFFRSRRAVASAVPGVGLGLVITKNIVEGHGGTLAFTSEAGKGSVFTVLLPKEALEAAAASGQTGR